MRQEDKELLLKDLSARLPYKVKCNVYNRTGTLIGVNDYGAEIDYGNGEDTTCEIQYCLPYLRPMSSITKDELKDFMTTWEALKHRPDTTVITPESYDWLNAHYFDYRGLIEKGLALEASERIYNLEKK